MSLHPHKGHIVQGKKGKQLLPQVGIFDFPASPARGLPGAHPSEVHGIHKIARIGIQRDGAGFAESGERRNGGGQLHAVVGRFGFAARQFPPGATVLQDRAVSAGAGIPPAGPVGINGDVFHFVSFIGFFQVMCEYSAAGTSFCPTFSKKIASRI